MAKNKVRKKPTAREMASTIIEINNKVNYLYDVIRGFDGVFTIFLEMENKKDKLEKKLEEIKKENERKANEQKENGKADTKDIPADSDNKGSGTERVRETAK